MAEPRKFPHHLIREIFEQPDALRRTIEPRVSLAEGRVRLDEIHISREELRALRRINIVASGTSRHAGMTGQYMMQELAARAGRCGLRERIRIPQPDDWAGRTQHLYYAVGRNRRHHRIAARSPRRRGRAPSPFRMSKARPLRARPTVSSTPTPVRRSASPRPRRSPHRWRVCFYSRSISAKSKRRFRRAWPSTTSANFSPCREKTEAILSAVRSSREAGRALLSRGRFHVSRPRHPLPHRDGWSSQAERSFLHSRRRLSHRRSQARAERADRFPLAAGHDRDLRPQRCGLGGALRTERQQHGRIQEARRDGDRAGDGRRHHHPANWRTTPSLFPRRRNFCRRFWRSSPYSCLPTM